MDPARLQDQRPQRRIGTRRERTGCLTCRRRKKKCDLVYPICGHCRRLNLECAHEEPRGDELVCQRPSSMSRPSSNQWPHPNSIVWSRASLRIPVGFHIGENDSPSVVRRRMFSYYTESLSPLLTTNLQNNSFLTVLLPMCMESSALQDGIVAWAASHLALWQDSFAELAMKSRFKSLKSLSQSISCDNYSPEIVLANTLVLCSMETILGTTQWFHHLQGACQVIKSSVDAGNFRQHFDSTEGHWLIRNYAYHDAMMSITLNRRPMLQYDLYGIAIDSGAIDAYVGLAFTPIKMVLEISHLRSDMFEQSATTGTEQEDVPATGFSAKPSFSQRAFAIEKLLKNWSYDRIGDAPLACLAETYRSAALIHLYRSIVQHLPEYAAAISQKISLQVGRICENVALMPLGCLPECTLLFPLFLAGSEAEAEEHISLIRHRMSRLGEGRNFENVRSALTVLEELWRLRAKGSSTESHGKVDFVDILERRKWTLALS